MATKKAAKKETNKLYAISSSSDSGDLGYPIASMEEVDLVLSGEWNWNDFSDEVVTVYELVPVKKYKKGPVYVEVK